MQIAWPRPRASIAASRPCSFAAVEPEETHPAICNRPDDPKVFQLQSAALGLGDQAVLRAAAATSRAFCWVDQRSTPRTNRRRHGADEAVVAGLPVLVSKVCGYAFYIDKAPECRVLDEPFEQAQLNQYLVDMPTIHKRAAWSRNGLAFGRRYDLIARRSTPGPDRAEPNR